MRVPKINRRQLAMVSVTAAPAVFLLVCFLIAKWRENPGYLRLDTSDLLVLYLGLFPSIMLGLGFTRPLINPTSRRGIFGGRKRPPIRLWMILVYVAAIAPCFALLSQSRREDRRRSEAWLATMKAFDDKQIAWFTKSENEDLARALESDRLAAECHEKAARGQVSERGRSWADRAADHERTAAFWRTQAAWYAGMRKEFDRSRLDGTMGSDVPTKKNPAPHEGAGHSQGERRLLVDP